MPRRTRKQLVSRIENQNYEGRERERERRWLRLRLGRERRTRLQDARSSNAA
jgi:hypothetical protein